MTITAILVNAVVSGCTSDSTIDLRIWPRAIESREHAPGVGPSAVTSRRTWRLQRLDRWWVRRSPRLAQNFDLALALPRRPPVRRKRRPRRGLKRIRGLPARLKPFAQRTRTDVAAVQARAEVNNRGNLAAAFLQPKAALTQPPKAALAAAEPCRVPNALANFRWLCQSALADWVPEKCPRKVLAEAVALLEGGRSDAVDLASSSRSNGCERRGLRSRSPPGWPVKIGILQA